MPRQTPDHATRPPSQVTAHNVPAARPGRSLAAGVAAGRSLHHRSGRWHRPGFGRPRRTSAEAGQFHGCCADVRAAGRAESCTGAISTSRCPRRGRGWLPIVRMTPSARSMHSPPVARRRSSSSANWCAAEIAMARGQYAAAWRDLAAVAEPASAAEATRLFLLRQEVALRAGQPLEAVRAGIARDRVASSDAQRTSARRDLLTDLRGAIDRGLRIDPAVGARTPGARLARGGPDRRGGRQAVRLAPRRRSNAGARAIPDIRPPPSLPPRSSRRPHATHSTALGPLHRDPSHCCCRFPETTPPPPN